MNDKLNKVLSLVISAEKLLSNPTDLSILQQKRKILGVEYLNTNTDIPTNIANQEEDTSGYDEIRWHTKNLISIILKKVNSNKKEISSDEARSIISEAIRYGIAFSLKGINILYLKEQVSQWKCLLDKADELKIKWNESNYNVRALEESLNGAMEKDEVKAKEELESNK